MAKKISFPAKSNVGADSKRVPEPSGPDKSSLGSAESFPVTAGPSPNIAEQSPKTADPSTKGTEPAADNTEQPVKVFMAGAEESITPTDDEIFGPLPAPQGESLENLTALLAAVVADVRPRDFIEKIYVRDVALLQFDLQRYRHLKSNLAGAAKLQGLRKILNDIDPNYNTVGWAERWVEGEPQALAFIPKLLAKSGFTEDSISDEAFMSKIDEIERVDRLIAQAEVRRAVALRELHRHRQALAEQLEASLEEFARGRIDFSPEASRRGGRQ